MRDLRKSINRTSSWLRLRLRRVALPSKRLVPLIALEPATAVLPQFRNEFATG